MKITFTQDHQVKQGDGQGPLYKAGQTYEFSGAVAETYARKYIARGYAVAAAKETPKPVKDAPLLDVPAAAPPAADLAQPSAAPKRSASR